MLTKSNASDAYSSHLMRHAKSLSLDAARACGLLARGYGLALANGSTNHLLFD